MPGEAAELQAVEDWAGPSSTTVRWVRAVPFVRAPYALKAGSYDLVLCDLAHGAETGLDLLREVRAAGIGVPFVFLTRGTAGQGSDVAGRARTLGHAVFVDRDSLNSAELERAARTATRSADEKRTATATTAASGIDVAPPVVAATREARSAPTRRLETSGAPAAEAIADFAPAMLFRTDAGGELNEFTREWLRFAGRSIDAERAGGWRERLHPEDTARFGSAVGRALARRAPFSVDVRLRRSDTQFRWLRLSGIPRTGATSPDKLTGFVGSAFDITDLIDRAPESAPSSPERFSHAVAHDLLEPLRSISVLLRSASAGMPDEAQVGQARELVARMQQMVREMLDCSTAAHASEPLESSPLREPLNWALSNLADQVARCGARIEIDPLPSALCDPPQIARVFQNLISNALKFRSEIRPHIRISGERRGDVTVVSVRDNGIGIDASQHERVFEMFHRVFEGTAIEGSGVGLTLCREIIERHSGEIRVESQLGGGATLLFTLPAG